MQNPPGVTSCLQRRCSNLGIIDFLMLGLCVPPGRQGKYTQPEGDFEVHLDPQTQLPHSLHSRSFTCPISLPSIAPSKTIWTPRGSPVSSIFLAKHLEMFACIYLSMTPTRAPLASLVAQMVKNLPAIWETLISGLGRSPGKGDGNPPPVFLLGESHGQKLQSTGWQGVGHD